MSQARSTTAAFVGALALGVVLGTWGGPAGSDLPLVGVERAAALEAFDDCDDLDAFLDDVVDQLVWDVPEVDVDPASGGIVVDDVAEDSMDFDVPGEPDLGAVTLDSGAPASAGARASAGEPAAELAADAGGADHSATNIQEAGVDEPDVVKTDGRRVVAIEQDRLRVLTFDGDLAPAGTVDLPGGWGHQLLLAGDRVLVLGSGDHGVQPLMRGDVGIVMTADNVTLTLVDIADPAAPEVVSTMEMEGSYVSARLIDGTARIVLRSYPPLAEDAGAEDALPHFRSDDGDPAPLVECRGVLVPPEPQGPGMTTVLSVDLQGPLAPYGATTVVADGHTVYATAERLYLAWSSWTPQGQSTDVHAFDITDPAQARYIGVGSVEGHLLNQWSLSRHDGHLRVATTIGDAWEGGSHSALTVLAESGGGLAQVGRVDGLGPDERIYAVRYLGDIGFVVTFRETDPLYSLDLSDPADPRVLGELKIPGFSNYLHPVGDGLLLGVGQDADEQGMPLGVQVSLFDVSDLANPARVQQHTIGEGHTMVEYDHRAFLWWAPANLAVLPVELWPEQFNGAVGLSVDRTGIAEAGRVPGPVERNLVIGDALLSYSFQGITVTDLASFAERARVRF